MRQNTSMSRGGSRRGGNRDTAEASHPDGWSVAGSGAPPRQQPKVGDLSQFGKISKTTPISFGPASVFSGKKGTDPKSRDPPMSRTPSTSSNMFSMLQSTDTVVDPLWFAYQSLGNLQGALCSRECESQDASTRSGGCGPHDYPNRGLFIR
jgi:hypothetical protein